MNKSKEMHQISASIANAIFLMERLHAATNRAKTLYRCDSTLEANEQALRVLLILAAVERKIQMMEGKI